MNWFRAPAPQMFLPMPFEIRLAWREIRPAFKKFLFMIIAIALGVGSVTGIKGFSVALDRAMARSARDLIAADIAVRMNSSPTDKEMQVLDSLVQRGAQVTRTTETLSMASVSGGQRTILVTVKAVDPNLYPYYGKVELEPDAVFCDALTDDSVVASREFLIRSGAGVGSSVQIGFARFRLAAVLKSEPDRISSGVELGPRVLIARKGLERSGLIQYGSRATESFLFRLPARGLELETARGILKAGLQGRVRISDYRDPNPALSQGLERMANFLSLVGLLALLVGGLGVGTTIHTYVQQKLDSIAILKSLGGRSSQIIRIYLFQGLFIGVLGSALGVALGYVVQIVFPPLLRGLMDLPTQLEPAPGAAVQGLLIGIVTTLLFLLPPLLAIRKVRPARVFLREMPETHYSTLRRLRHDRTPLICAVILLLGIGILASWVADSWRRGALFIAGLAVAILALAAGAKLLLRALRHVPRPNSLALRHGLKNLNRPGNHMASVLVALGIGVAFSLTVYLVQTSLLPQIIKNAPADYPNVFLLGITELDRDAVWRFLRGQPGIENAGKPIPMVPARLQKIEGRNADQLNLEPSDRRFFNGEFMLTWSSDLPPGTRLTAGRWWTPPYEGPLVSVGDFAARRLKIGVGNSLEFLSGEKVIRGKVASIRETDFERPGTNNQFVFSPGVLEGLPASYVGSLRVARPHVVPLQSALFARFPNVTSLDVGQILGKVQELLDKIAHVIRFVAFFAILSGVIILASSIVATRYQRTREAVLLKTLGATRSQVARIQAAEFLIVGLAAGVIGCLLASAAADYLLGHLLDTKFSFQWVPVIVGTLCTAALAIATGWLASRGVLNHKPLEILREN